MNRDLIETFERLGVRDVEITDDVDKAVARITAIYERAVERLRTALGRFQAEGVRPAAVDAFYPFVGLRIESAALNLDGRLAYGALHDPGVYGATLTHPRLFQDYYRTQLGLLVRNHGAPLATGVSDRPIPLPFVVDEIGAGLSRAQLNELQYLFAMPDLSRTDDAIANGTWRSGGQEPAPLALFTAERVDYSLQRLAHYTGTHPEYFQRFVLLTNYQRYVEHFCAFGREAIETGSEYDRFVWPGDAIFYNRRLRDEAASLSGVMIDGGDATAVAERIAALWDAVKSEVGAARPDLLASFENSVALAAKAARFSRAADADKASRNFDALVSSYLEACSSTGSAPAGSAHRRGQRPGVHDGEPTGAAGERHVERTQPLLFGLDDRGGLDHHDAVELEALHHADRHHGDRRTEAAARGATVFDTRGGERLRHLLDHRVRGDDRDAAIRHGRAHRRRGIGDLAEQLLGGVGADELGMLVAGAHADRRPQRRGGRLSAGRPAG